MSQIEMKRTVNLDRLVTAEALPGALYHAENQAHKFVIAAKRGDADVTLSGTVFGSFVRYGDGETVPLTGAIEDGCAAITLISNCYLVPGRFDLAVYVTEGGVTTMVYACTGHVRATETGEAVDPSGEVALNVAQLIADIDAAVDSIPTEYTELENEVADLWKAMGGIADYNLFGSAGFVHGYYINSQGVETAGSGFAHTGIISVTPSQTYHFAGTAINRGSGWTMRFHVYKDGVWERQLLAVSVPGTGGAIEQDMTLVSGENGVAISFIDGAIENSIFVGPNGQTAIDRVARAMFADYFKCTSARALPSGDLNDYYGVSGSWLLISSASYQNAPDGLTAGFLLCYAALNNTLQIFYPFTQNAVYKRRGNATAWSAWLKISGMLDSTGDATNRTSDITSRLTADKVCQLGPGVFYVDGVDMPDDSAIIGAGPSTKIILLGTDTTEGYAVKLGSRCSISHVSVLGNAEDHTANADRYDRDAAYVERHGILFEGNVTPSVAGDTTRRANVSDCFIANFPGGGITLQKTGLNTISGINVSDCYIWHCYAGINVAYYSEFNRFANVSVGFCHYGAINNGGNNSFVNCNFSANIEGMLIDNTNGKSPNNSHGSVSNCIFDHSDQNYGIGIHLIGVSFGEVFSNCQLFFSEIVIENSNGIVFSSLNAGNHESITVKNCKGVTFASCMFRTMPWFITTGNQKMIVRDCLAYDEASVTDVMLSNVDVTAMPQDFTGAIGQTATFTVTAENVASYQWQWRYADHSRDWTDTTAAGNKTASISMEITAARLTYEYRCVMLDSAGNAAYTNPVRIIEG